MAANFVDQKQQEEDASILKFPKGFYILNQLLLV